MLTLCCVWLRFVSFWQFLNGKKWHVSWPLPPVPLVSLCIHICLYVRGLITFNLSFQDSDKLTNRCLSKKLGEKQKKSSNYPKQPIIKIERLCLGFLFFFTVFFFSTEKVRSTQRNSSHRKTLIKYCWCAWGLPAVITVTCFALDHSGAIKIGYGRQTYRRSL